jgi:hypothetical protein
VRDKIAEKAKKQVFFKKRDYFENKPLGGGARSETLLGGLFSPL